MGGPLLVVKVFAQIWHPKSTPYYLSLPIILSVTHIFLFMDTYTSIRMYTLLYIYMYIYIYIYIYMYVCMYIYIYRFHCSFPSESSSQIGRRFTLRYRPQYPLRQFQSGPRPVKMGESIAGWWLGHPSEKYESVNWDDWKPNSHGKIKNGNQTTNLT